MTKKLVVPAGEAEKIVERRALIWKLRRSGGTLYSIHEDIAKLGFPVSISTVAKDIQQEMTRWREMEGEEAQAWRDDTIAKLDELIKTQMELAADKRNIRSADNANAAVRAMERKAKLLGIDAPEGINAAVHSVAELIYTVRAAQD